MSRAPDNQAADEIPLKASNRGETKAQDNTFDQAAMTLSMRSACGRDNVRVPDSRQTERGVWKALRKKLCGLWRRIVNAFSAIPTGHLFYGERDFREQV